MNYLDLLGPKFVLFSIGLVGVACAAGDPVDNPRHSNQSGNSGGTLNTGNTTGMSSNTSTGTGNMSSTTTTTSGAGGSGTGAGGSGNASGSAGTAVSGTGGSGGGASAPHMAVDSTFATNGYGNNGTWKGYAFTTTFGTTATISPVCPSPCFTMAAKQLCAEGTVKGDMMLASGASLGWNINQAEMMPNPVQTLATTGSGLTVNVPGATATMRVQISAGTSQWCAPMPAGGNGTVKWGDFKTKCWEGGGTAYKAGTPVEAIQLVVPSATTDVPFSFCLVSATIAP